MHCFHYCIDSLVVTTGSGLGKQEHGRSDPIKVTLKMDKTGVFKEQLFFLFRDIVINES